MKDTTNLLMLYGTAFVVGGFAGSGLFYLWAGSTTMGGGVQSWIFGDMVRGWDYDQLKSHMALTFLIGGLLAMGSVYKTIGRSDP